MTKPYSTAISRQTARQIRRNRRKNIPRLNQLKECVGCMACGRTIPGEFLDGHHIDRDRKYKPLSYLCNRRWPRLVREVFGLDRDKAHGGGPIEIVCRRYHQARHQLGDEALTCPVLEAQGVQTPWLKVHKKREHGAAKTDKQ